LVAELIHDSDERVTDVGHPAHTVDDGVLADALATGCVTEPFVGVSIAVVVHPVADLFGGEHRGNLFA
jgi:hypothetical protein